MEKLRKARINQDEELINLINCRQRFILLKSRKNLTERGVEYLNRLCEINQAIYKAMLPKESFLEKIEYINWFKRKMSSVISEGFNNKIKRLKRIAYSYKDIDYFRLKIQQHCGLLNPRLFN
jgi:transposase